MPDLPPRIHVKYNHWHFNPNPLISTYFVARTPDNHLMTNGICGVFDDNLALYHEVEQQAISDAIDMNCPVVAHIIGLDNCPSTSIAVYFETHNA